MNAKISSFQTARNWSGPFWLGDSLTARNWSGPFWLGDSLFLSINPNRHLGEGDNSQRWSTPVHIIHRPGHKLWYPSLQPTDSAEDLAAKRTCLRLGRSARLWFKDGSGVEGVSYEHIYISDHELELTRGADV